ncbi:MAG: flavodoxin [Actinomycetota bacterium]|jgi:flavodoxin|nr:flavodoxin [Actinomycetota bacterium]
MKAVVVYESVWGNTATIARAIAEGIGNDTRALNTSEATPQALAGVDLVVGGAPLMAFTLPTESSRKQIGADPKHRDNPPNLSNPSMRAWLKALGAGSGHGAGFETGFNWSPGSAAKRLAKGLSSAGYKTAMPHERFLVTGTYGPLRDGEIERAREWGATIAGKIS